MNDNSSAPELEIVPKDIKIQSSPKDGEHELGTDLDIFVKRKILYHGSATSGISRFNHAEEDTVGSGIYFTSSEKSAAEYARNRAEGKTNEQIVYKVLVEDLRLANLTTDENAKKILMGYIPILRQKVKDHADKWYVVEGALRSIEAVNADKAGAGKVKNATFGTGEWFSEYLSSLGYDGLIALEGGEKGVGAHDSYVIFNPEKVKILQEQKLAE